MRWNLSFVGSICGIIAPIIFLIFYLIAWSQSPWYEFGGNYLSDLGVGEGAWAFNSGNVIAGTLAIPFAATLWKILKPDRLSVLGSTFFAAGGVALAGIGIVNENMDGHVAVSAAFFILALLFEILLGLCLIRNENTRHAGYFVTALLLATLAAAGAVGINPLSETVAVMEILAWTLVVGCQSLLITFRER